MARIIWHQQLAGTGRVVLGGLGGLVDGADPDGTVSGPSRLLCAGLAELALVTYRGLGGTRQRTEVARAAALLSLLTKIDDQVIDSLAFHGGHTADRAAVRAKTSAYLAPTLESIRRGEPSTAEPRCALAADLGRALHSLGGGMRLERLLALIARGWEIQVDAVAVLTAHPSTVTSAEVREVTANISGAWLMMIAMVGTLPVDAGRMLTLDEERAFYGWGLHMQRADALADLAKDLEQGLISTAVVRQLWGCSAESCEEALERGDIEQVYRLVAEHDVDRSLVADRGDLPALRLSLAGLGELPDLLGWILGFLTWRYRVATPTCRAPDDSTLAGSPGSEESWRRYVVAASRGRD